MYNVILLYTIYSIGICNICLNVQLFYIYNNSVLSVLNLKVYFSYRTFKQKEQTT